MFRKKKPVSESKEIKKPTIADLLIVANLAGSDEKKYPDQAMDASWERLSPELDKYGAIGFYVKAYVLLQKSGSISLSSELKKKYLEESYTYFLMAYQSVDSAESKKISKKELKIDNLRKLDQLPDKEGRVQDYMKTALLLLKVEKFDKKFLENFSAFRVAHEHLVDVLGRDKLAKEKWLSSTTPSRAIKKAGEEALRIENYLEKAQARLNPPEGKTEAKRR